MSAGSYERDTRKAIDTAWGNDGYCVRWPQSRGSVGVIADLLLFTRDPVVPNYAIEIKRITVKKGKKLDWLKAPGLNFKDHFTWSTARSETRRHQLQRQVELSEIGGFVPVLYLKVVRGNRSDAYMFDSKELYDYWMDGHPSLNSDDFERFHRPNIVKALRLDNNDGKGKSSTSKTKATRSVNGRAVPKSQRSLSAFAKKMHKTQRQQ